MPRGVGVKQISVVFAGNTAIESHLHHRINEQPLGKQGQCQPKFMGTLWALSI
jgi:hypothetical protein